jgi:restriction endonuclease Mrr
MAIPDYQACFRPVLDLAAREPTSRASATEALSNLFNLSPEDLQERIPSGHQTYILSRVGWAMTYLTKAGLIEKTGNRPYTATQRGREFLSRYPDRLGNREHRTLRLPSRFLRLARRMSASMRHSVKSTRAFGRSSSQRFGESHLSSSSGWCWISSSQWVTEVPVRTQPNTLAE